MRERWRALENQTGSGDWEAQVNRLQHDLLQQVEDDDDEWRNEDSNAAAMAVARVLQRMQNQALFRGLNQWRVFMAIARAEQQREAARRRFDQKMLTLQQFLLDNDPLAAGTNDADTTDVLPMPTCTHAGKALEYSEDTDEPPSYFVHAQLPPLLETRYEQTMATRPGLAAPVRPALMLAGPGAHYSANYGVQNAKRQPPSTPQRKRHSRSASISPQPGLAPTAAGGTRTLPALPHNSPDTGGQPGAERQMRKAGSFGKSFAKIRRMVLGVATGAQQPTSAAPTRSPNRTGRKLRANWAADPELKGQEAALSVRSRITRLNREELR
jgi:hypothetical protein